MDLKSRTRKLKGLLNKLAKAGIDLNSVTDKGEDQLLHPKTLSKFEKLVKRALERPSIIKESQQITERMRERVKQQREVKQARQDAKNEKFLEAHPQFKQVFRYDVKHNKSGDAQMTAKSYMTSRKNRLIKSILNNFDNVSSSFKKQLKAMIKDNSYDIDLLEGMENISQYLVYNKDSNPDDVTIDYGEFNSADDEYINRLLNRFSRLKRGD